MTLTRLVNGVRENLTGQEAIDAQSRWDADDQARDDFEALFGYLANRRGLYPIIVESLEAIIAGFQAIRDFEHHIEIDDDDIEEGQDAKINLPQVTLDWLSNIEAIHAQFPPP